jgi:hypothetical protein
MITGEVQFDTAELLKSDDVHLLYKPVGKVALLTLLQRFSDSEFHKANT